jgi:hypothetical protein
MQASLLYRLPRRSFAVGSLAPGTRCAAGRAGRIALTRATALSGPN